MELKQKSHFSSLAELLESPSHIFTKDYFGSPLSINACFSLTLERECLHFGFSSGTSAWCETHALGEFIEGLWQRDAAELFLSWGEAGYEEFNLSPHGAWWHASFSAPRTRIETKALPGVQTESRIGLESWSTGLIMPLTAEKMRALRQGAVRLNVTAILTPNRVHLSWADLPTERLDFHQPKYFSPVCPP